jgi:hypothetical protein
MVIIRVASRSQFNSTRTMNTNSDMGLLHLLTELLEDSDMEIWVRTAADTSLVAAVPELKRTRVCLPCKLCGKDHIEIPNSRVVRHSFTRPPRSGVKRPFDEVAARASALLHESIECEENLPFVKLS